MRTKNSLKNIITSVSLTLIVGILGFLKVRVFINGLSDDIYSLHQLFYQIFSYLTITDIGFSLLLSKALYNAFAKDDKEEIINIYSTSKKFYNIVGLLMLIIAFILSFFVQFLTKADVNHWYIQLIFIVFIIRNVIDYFFIAPRFVMEANQQSYKINIYIKGIKILETIIEIILVLLGIDYIFILIPGIILTVLVDLYANKKVFLTYPWLKNNKTFNKNYLKGTKELIWRKLADLLNSNTDIILISTFINPLSVIIYTSYVYITKFITDVIYLVSNSLTPSYANIIYKENKEKAYSVFTEINIFFLFVATFINIMLFAFLNPLINFWVGSKYLVNTITLIMFTFICFQTISTKPIAIYINSKCLFKETKIATIIEAIINLVLSLILVNKVGLIGVLIGTIVAKLLTSFIQNPYYIYKNEFNISPLKYFITYFLVLLINAIFIGIFTILKLEFNSVLIWLISVVASSIILGLVLYIIFYILFKSFRLVHKRGIEFIKVKGRYEA
jgi:O-antigen/teichoic acid export membrane protein